MFWKDLKVIKSTISNFNCILNFLRFFLMSELETSCHIFQIQLCSCAHEIYWFIISLSLHPLLIFLFNECKNISFDFFKIYIRLRCLSRLSDLLVCSERFHRDLLDFFLFKSIFFHRRTSILILFNCHKSKLKLWILFTFLSLI
jgi:hypothetical protein